MACDNNPFKGNELSDSDRAHSGKPGSEVRHGADALKRAPKARFEYKPDAETHDRYSGTTGFGLGGPNKG